MSDGRTDIEDSVARSRAFFTTEVHDMEIRITAQITEQLTDLLTRANSQSRRPSLSSPVQELPQPQVPRNSPTHPRVVRQPSLMNFISRLGGSNILSPEA
jgi:hypothetical protein